MNNTEFVIINTLTGEEKKVSETEFKQHRKTVNNYWVKHRRRSMCDVELYNKAVALCPMDCSICEHSCDNNCVSLEEVYEGYDHDKDLDSALIDTETPESIYECKVLYQKLHEKIDELPELDRNICCLFMEGKNFSEISAELDVDKATIGRHFPLITKHLANELKSYL